MQGKAFSAISSRSQPAYTLVEGLGDAVSARLLVRSKGSSVGKIYATVAKVDGVSFVSNEALQRGEG